MREPTVTAAPKFVTGSRLKDKREELFIASKVRFARSYVAGKSRGSSENLRDAFERS